jgi:hypothetical protein
MPIETFTRRRRGDRDPDGLYKSAEEGRTIAMPCDLTDFVPQVARGAWQG